MSFIFNVIISQLLHDIRDTGQTSNNQSVPINLNSNWAHVSETIFTVIFLEIAVMGSN